MGLDRMQLGANLTTLTLVVSSTLTYYVCWRWAEVARARRMAKGGHADPSSLPSPAAVLPRWLPFLGGHTLQMETEKLNQQLEAWADELGSVYELTVAGSRVVFVTNAEDFGRILLLRPTVFRRGWTPTQFPGVADKLGLHFLFFDEGKQWGRSRRIISPALSGHHNVADMVPAVAKIAERVCAKLEDQNGDTVEFAELFERYTHDVIALAAFGFDADSVRATEDRPSVSYEAMRVIILAIMRLMMDPLSMLGWATIPALLPWVRATKSGTRRLHQVVEGAIDAMRRQMQEGGEFSHENGGALLRKLISVQGSGDGPTKGVDDRMKFSDREILTQVTGLFAAGYETTSKTISWALYYLAKHPEMHARCREEALRVAPLSGGIVSTAEQASQLVFCAALFKETLRLWPAGSVLFLHSTEPTTLKSGIEFEAGTPFTLVLRYPCLSEDAFTRAKDFVPERWIEAEREEALRGESSKAGESIGEVVHREEVLHAFGAGPRKCPGASVANLEATMILSAICARFDLALAPGQDDPPVAIMTFATGPKSLSLVVTRRPA